MSTTSPEKNRTCFYCRVPVLDNGSVFFQMGECAVPVCLVCDDKLSSMVDRDDEEAWSPM